MTSTAVLISGGARFGDPWHPFGETSAALTDAVSARGWTVDRSDDADAGLAALVDGPPPGLLVINIGWYGPERLTEEAGRGLVSALDRGTPTLLVHSTLTAFPAWPLWHRIAGGGWTYGTTYHPDYAPAIALPRPDHELSAELTELAITDERYTRLWVDPSSSVFLEHEEAGERHPLAWTRRWGSAAIVADALGHDAGSYRAAGRATLLDRELDWLTGR